MSELWKMTAVEAVARLKKKEITPLDLVEASAKRMAEVEPAVNAMPTLCLDRARDHAKALMAGKRREEVTDRQVTGLKYFDHRYLVAGDIYGRLLVLYFHA